MPPAPVPADLTAAASTSEAVSDPHSELDRQAAVWAGLGHELSDLALDSLRAALADDPTAPTTQERVPFVLVMPGAGIPAERAMARTSLGGRPGSVNQHAGDIDSFAPMRSVGQPPAGAYLLVDVERGSEFCGVPPELAVITLAERGRTPLTVAEGVALITVHPEVLETNHCFSLAGSRAGDRRVPAIWISKRAPHLGWCFAGTPHSWLGVASAGARRPPPASSA